PAPVGDPDHERLLDVEVDPVAASRCAVEGDGPLVVGQDRVEVAPVGVAGLEPCAAKERDDLAPAAVLAAHHRAAGYPPDDVTRECGSHRHRVLAEGGEDAAHQRGVRVLAPAHASPVSVSTTASAITLSGRPDAWLALRSRPNASCSLSCSFSMRSPLARSITFRAASASESDSASAR